MKHIFLKLSKLPKGKRYIFYIVITLITAVFFDRVILQTARNRIKKLNNEIFIQERKLQKYLHILSKEDLVTGEYKKYTEGISQDHSEEEEKLELLSEIEKIARNASLLLKDIKPGVTKKIGLYKEYTIEIEVESEISYLVDFIYQLERTSRLLRIDGFQLRPKEKKSVILKAQMTITEVVIEKGKKGEEGEGGVEEKTERLLP